MHQGFVMVYPLGFQQTNATKDSEWAKVCQVFEEKQSPHRNGDLIDRHLFMNGERLPIERKN